MPENVSTAKTAQSFLKNIKNASFDRIAEYIFLIGVLLLPLFFLPAISFSIDISKTLFLTVVVVLAFLFWLLSCLKNGSITIPLHPLFIVGGSVALVFIVSALVSPATHNSLFGFAYELGTATSMVALFIFMFLAALFFDSQKKITQFYQYFLVVFGIIFLFQIIRLLFGADLLSFGGFLQGKSGNVIGKWNDFAIFAGVITLLSFITLEKVILPKFAKIALYISLAASLLLLAIVNFYLVWIILGIIALIILVYNFSFSHVTPTPKIFGVSSQSERGFTKNTPRFGHIFLSPSFIVTVVALIFLIGGGTIGGYINQKLNIVQIEARPSWASTSAVLKETIQERPLFGSGPNRFTNQWFQFKPQSINNSSFWNSEFRFGVGTLPTFAVTVGVLGSVAWATFLLLFFTYGFKIILSPSRSGVSYSLFSLFALATYVWAISFFYVPNITIFSLAFLFTGMFIGISAQEGLVKKRSFLFFDSPRVGFISVLVLSLLIIGTVVFGYALSKQFFALKNFHKAQIALISENNLQEAEERVTKALRQTKSDVYYRAFAEIKTRQIKEFLLRSDISPEEARSQFQSLLGVGINAGQLATQFDKTNYANWLALARVYGSVTPLVTGAYENARISLVEAQSKYPQSPLILLEHARLEIANRNMVEARRYIGEALVMKQDYASAIFLLAQLQLSEGNVAEAIRSIEAAVLAAPNDEGLLFQLGLLKFNTGDFDGARAVFAHAVELNPVFANAKYFLGLSYYNVKRVPDAILQFEDLQKSNPSNEEIKNILNNLKTGNGPFSDAQEPVLLEEREEPPLEE